MKSSDFTNKAGELVEEFFPKGKARGQALVLVAMLLVYLQDEGVVS